MSADGRSVLVVRIGTGRFGLLAVAVESVVQMVEITPLPQAPAPVHGVIDAGGEIVPVFGMQRRFAMPDPAWGARDYLVLARAAGRRVALAVEEVLEVREPGEEWVERSAIAVGNRAVAGAVRTADGLILIQDLDTFLFPEEERQLEEALAERREGR